MRKHTAKRDEYSQEKRESKAKSAARGRGRGRGRGHGRGRGRGGRGLRRTQAAQEKAKEMSQLLDDFVPDSSNRLA